MGLFYARAVRADGRYAPSPTGPLHLGNLRTALLAWLFARSRDARFLLRVEDLDPQRSRREHEAGQLADLAALGLDWDGEPLRQSERGERYAEAVESLRAQGLVYECFCTRAEIREAASAPHGRDAAGGGRSTSAMGADPAAAFYPGTCRSLTAAERAEHLAAGRPPALRVRADAARISFRDLLAGEVNGIVDDVVIRRNDGAYAYNLAVTVDDADQGVDEVVRGADLLDATAGQRWLAELLGLTPPSSYAHVPLLRGEDGRAARQAPRRRHARRTPCARSDVRRRACRARRLGRPLRAGRATVARRARRALRCRGLGASDRGRSCLAQAPSVYASESGVDLRLSVAVCGLNVNVPVSVPDLAGSGHDMEAAASFLNTTVVSLTRNDVATSVSSILNDWAPMWNLQTVLPPSTTQIVMLPPKGTDKVPPHELAATLWRRCSSNGVTESAVVVQKTCAPGNVGLEQKTGSSDVTSARVCVIGT